MRARFGPLNLAQTHTRPEAGFFSFIRHAMGLVGVAITRTSFSLTKVHIDIITLSQEFNATEIRALFLRVAHRTSGAICKYCTYQGPLLIALRWSRKRQDSVEIFDRIVRWQCKERRGRFGPLYIRKAV